MKLQRKGGKSEIKKRIKDILCSENSYLFPYLLFYYSHLNKQANKVITKVRKLIYNLFILTKKDSMLMYFLK